MSRVYFPSLLMPVCPPAASSPRPLAHVWGKRGIPADPFMRCKALVYKTKNTPMIRLTIMIILKLDKSLFLQVWSLGDAAISAASARIENVAPTLTFETCLQEPAACIYYKCLVIRCIRIIVSS